MTAILPELATSVLEMGQAFGDLFAMGALQAVLLSVGALFVGGASVVFGYCALGGLSSAFLPEVGRGRTHQ